MSAGEDDLTDLLAGARAGHRGALARLITRVERGGDDAARVAARLPPADDAAHVVGVTGAPGAGKSSLVGHLLAHLVGRGRRPAALAIDPSSPVSGGALLGDRIRMDDVAAGAFVRSMATRGERGGLAAAVPAVLRLLAYAGYAPLIVETTGVGQVEVGIAAAADTTVLVLAPGWGDAVQASKAGLLELADVLVVNKADLPGARAARSDLRAMVGLGPATRGPEIVMATSTTGEGADAVWRAVAAHADAIAADGGLAARRAARRRSEVAALVEREMRGRVAAALDDDEGRAVLAQLGEGRIAPAEAARRLIDRVVGEG